MTVQLERIKKICVADQITNQVVGKILSGEWKAGDKLPSEAELMRMLGVSKYMIRNVLSRLNDMGVIETHQGAGSFVTDLYSVDCLKPLIPIVFMDSHRYLTVAQFRMGIETEAVRLATKQVTKEQLSVMWNLYEKMTNSVDDLPCYCEADMDFHIQLAKASGNLMFEQSMNIIKMLYMADVKIVTDTRELSVHKEILEAVEQGNSDLSAERMRKHISIVIENAQKYDDRLSFPENVE